MKNDNSNINATVIIQVRLQSTRLKSKALLPLSERPIIEHVIERAKKISGIVNVIIAAGNNEDNSPLNEIANRQNVQFFQGSEEDVLERFYAASKTSISDYYIRVTGDNPLTDFTSASAALIYAAKNNLDHCYISNMPVGTGVEIISSHALTSARANSTENYQHEHVTPYIKENPQLFKLGNFDPLAKTNINHRLTVDTSEDYELMSKIYDELYKGSPIEIKKVLEYLNANPEISKINEDIIQRPMKHSSINE